MPKPNLDGVEAGNVEEPAVRGVLDAPAVIPAVLNDMDIFDVADAKTLSNQPDAEANDNPRGGHGHIQGLEQQGADHQGQRYQSWNYCR